MTKFKWVAPHKIRFIEIKLIVVLNIYIHLVGVNLV